MVMTMVMMRWMVLKVSGLITHRLMMVMTGWMALRVGTLERLAVMIVLHVGAVGRLIVLGIRLTVMIVLHGGTVERLIILGRLIVHGRLPLLRMLVEL